MDPLIPISITKSYFILDEPIPEILLMIIYNVYIPLCFLVGKNWEASKPPQFFPCSNRGDVI